MPECGACTLAHSCGVHTLRVLVHILLTMFTGTYSVVLTYMLAGAMYPVEVPAYFWSDQCSTGVCLTMPSCASAVIHATAKPEGQELPGWSLCM